MVKDMKKEINRLSTLVSKDDTPIPLTNKAFQRIIQFYLFECPVRTRERIPKKDRDPNDPQAKYKFRFKRVAKRGKSFEDRGLDGAKLNTLRAAMKRVSNVKLEAVAENEVTDPGIDEYIIIRRNEENTSITEGYFYCIRNAFAHGNFDVVNGVYYLRNMAGDTIKGLAKLKEETLLAWIELVNMTPEELKQKRK